MTDLRIRRVAQKPSRDMLPVLLPVILARDAAVDRIAKLLGDADGGELAMGMISSSWSGHAGVRPDGRAQFRSRRIHLGRRLCRNAGAVAARRPNSFWLNLAVLAPATVLSMPSRRAGAGGGTGADPAGLWPAPRRSDDDGRIDHRRTTVRGGGHRSFRCHADTLRGSFIVGDIAIAKYACWRCWSACRIAAFSWCEPDRIGL